MKNNSPICPMTYNSRQKPKQTLHFLISNRLSRKHTPGSTTWLLPLMDQTLLESFLATHPSFQFQRLRETH
jgi:hypothetical protein